MALNGAKVTAYNCSESFKENPDSGRNRMGDTAEGGVPDGAIN
jgi:hypothetical protein